MSPAQNGRKLYAPPSESANAQTCSGRPGPAIEQVADHRLRQMDTAECLPKSITLEHAIANRDGEPRQAALDSKVRGTDVLWHHATVLVPRHSDFDRLAESRHRIGAAGIPISKSQNHCDEVLVDRI